MHIDLKEYTYDLPEEKIAKEPLAQRSDSKLLHFDKGAISHHRFKDIAELLPNDSQLIFNDTRVIPARLHFFKETGALIEIFLLEPVAPDKEIAGAMTVTGQCIWKCMIGNLKKWKDGQQLFLNIDDHTTLTASLENRSQGLVQLVWNTETDFATIVEQSGNIPLPPYINREVTANDFERYQTVYGKYKGAVAAPTAGLHFDDVVLDKLKKRGLDLDYVTLHVSAGTFQPVKTANAMDHDMHSEQIIIRKEIVEKLLKKEKTIAVGTTAMRTLESLYWYGVKLINGDSSFHIAKMAPYHKERSHSVKDSLKAVLNYMNEHNLKTIHGTTEIFIVPGYDFKICKGLITNYHLPASTLVLLVAAFIGKQNRERVYDEALARNYRFLSYGDSSLLMP